MQRTASADLWSGILFAGVGLIFVLVGREYPYQSAAEMGPGFFPAWLGSGLALYGSALAAKGAAAGSEPILPFAVRPAVLILISLLLFAFLLERTGLAVAGLVMLGIASLAVGGFRPGSLLAFASGLIAFAAVLFVRLLDVHIAIWPSLGR